MLGKRKLTDKEKRTAIADRRAKERKRDPRARFHIRIGDETDTYGNPVFTVTKISRVERVRSGFKLQHPIAS